MTRLPASSVRLLGLMLTLAVGESLQSQDLPVEIAFDQAETKDPNQRSHNGVYLDDSLEATEIIAEVFEKAAERNWQVAIDKLELVFRQFGRKVISAGDGIYLSIPRFVHQEIVRWPAEGLSAYRRRFEPAAEKIFEEALRDLDPEKLAEVFGHYYCTTIAIRAGDMLAQVYLESGRFGAARKIFERLIATHPQRGEMRAEWQTKLAICRAFSGDVEAASTFLKQADDALHQRLFLWKGGRSFAQSMLQEIEANLALGETARPQTDWPTIGGNFSRTLIPRSDVAPTAPLWTFDAFAPSMLSGADGYFQSSSFHSAYSRGKFLALQPAVAFGKVFFNDAVGVWAIDLETGGAAWSYEGVVSREKGSGWGDRSVPSLHSCTLFNGRVFADLSHRPASYYGYHPPSIRSALVCLDAATGRLIWQVQPQDYGEDPREVEFEGPVVADDSGVYVLARRRKAFGFEDAYLWKFEHTGRFRWRTHLASGSTGGFGYRRPTLAIPTLINGTMFIQTNLGAIAAVDVNTGLVEWISVYGTADAGQQDRWQSTRANEIYPWQYNPLFPLPNGQLLSLPLDLDEVLLIDQNTGHISHRTPKGQMHQVNTILGVDGSRVYGLGEQLFCWDARSHSTVWARPLPESPIYGRGACSDSRIYIPCRSGLFTYKMGGGEPTVKAWDHTQQGGNVVVLADRIIVAGNDRITLYGIREDVFSRLRARMEADPLDARAALNLSEVAYRTAFSQPAGPNKQSDYMRARQALDAAVQRAGGFAAIWEEQLKSRLFEDCLEFANFYLQEEPPDTEDAISVLIMAGQCPPDAESLLRQKSLLASTYALRFDYTNEIRQYHHVLSDRSLRSLPWPDASATNTPAHEACRRRIAAVLQEHGREAYRPFDVKASELLAAATQANDLKRLDHILEVMPNSLAAPKALLAKGSILRDKKNQPLRAARAYYATLTRYPKVINRPEVFRQIADCYARAGQPTTAWQWLTKASREFPDAIVKSGEDSLTFLEYRALLGDIGNLLRLARPRVGNVLHEQYEIELGEEDSLLYPEFARHRAADWSHFLIYQDESAVAINAATGQRRWPRPLLVGQRPRLLAMLQHVIVVATGSEIIGVQPVTGKVAWRYGHVDPQRDLPATDPEDFPQWRFHRIREDRLISSRSDGHTVCIELRSGQIIWKQDLQPHPTQAASIGDQLTVYRAVSGDQQIFPVISTETGEWERTIRLPEQRPVLRIMHTLAGNVIFVTSQSLSAADPLSAKMEWQVQFDQNLLVGSVQVVLDGIILSADGVHVIKLSLDDGRQLWQSHALGLIPSELHVQLSQDELYVANQRRLISVDPHTGATLRTYPLQQGHELELLDLADRNLILVRSSRPQEQAFSEYWISITDRPARVEKFANMDLAQPLGEFPKEVEFHLFDHTIIASFEDTLRGWTNPPKAED